MDTELIEEIRRRSVVPGRRKTWTSKLDDRTLREVCGKLKAGYSDRRIARELQGKGILANVRENSVSQGIGKLRKRILPLLNGTPQERASRPGEAESPGGNGRDRAETKTRSQDVSRADGDDLFARLEVIERDCTARIESMLAEERVTGIRSPNFARELAALTSFCKQRAKLEDSRKRPPAAASTKAEAGFKRLQGLVGDPQRFKKTAYAFLEDIENQALDLITDDLGNERLIPPGGSPDGDDLDAAIAEAVGFDL